MQQKILTRLTRSLLWRTGLGRKIASLFWRNRSEGPGYQQLHFRQENVFEKIPTNFEDPIFSEFIKKDSARWNAQAEYVLAIEDVVLEPERLLGTRGFNELIEQTVVFKQDRQYPYILPHLLNRHAAHVIPEAILYDGSATRNYYHHFVDALSALTVWSKTEIPTTTPLIVNRYVYEQPYFQYLYKRSQFFSNLNWLIIEPNEWVRVRRLYKMGAIHFGVNTWRQMRQIYELPNIRPHRRIFLNRDRRIYGRYLANEGEVCAMLQMHGFEIVLAEHLSIEEQATLFQETEYMVALHGAGLSQMFFMNPMYSNIIEIMPKNYLMPLYYWQAYTMGMRYYDVVVGGIMTDGKEYSVDIVQLEIGVKQMLENTSSAPVYGKKQLNQEIK